MRGPHWRIFGLLTIVLLAAVAWPLASLRRSSQAGNERTKANDGPQERIKTPPEDSFLAQRVIHGGIPTGARERARAQVARARMAARASASSQPDSQLAATPWQFVGPTSIGGRIVDIAVDPVAPDT